MMLYLKLLKPSFLYGSSVWSSTSKGNLNSILRLQKRAARVILNAPFNSQDSWTCLIYLQRLPLTRSLEGFFFLSVETWVFAGHQSTVSMGFSRSLIEKVPSSLNEGGETYKNNFE